MTEFGNRQLPDASGRRATQSGCGQQDSGRFVGQTSVCAGLEPRMRRSGPAEAGPQTEVCPTTLRHRSISHFSEA